MSPATTCMDTRRVLICEDSQTYAAGLSRLLSRDPEIEVVGICPSAEDTISRLATMDPVPHLVTMDLELPGMSGGQAIEQIMSTTPVPILVLSGRAGGPSTIAASLGAGALEVLSKDALDLRDPDGAGAEAFRRRVKVLSNVRVVRHPRARLGSNGGAAGSGVTAHRASVIGICASAGGPQALVTVLGQLPAGYPIPILVVQHIASGFVEGFARWLDDQVPVGVRVAEAGRVRPGVWVAPGGTHLRFSGGRMQLDDEGDGGHHKPSGDALLNSIAAGAGPTGVAVVLTGMGRDGANGFEAVGRAGGLTIAQDQASSAVFGMPKAAGERGADLVLAPLAIGRRLAALSAAVPVT